MNEIISILIGVGGALLFEQNKLLFAFGVLLLTAILVLFDITGVLFLLAIFCISAFFTLFIKSYLMGKRFTKTPEERLEASKYQVEIPVKGGSNVYIKNLRQGIVGYGASGSGKSESLGCTLLEHFNKYNFALVLYDHKNFELTQFAYNIYRNNTNVSFHSFAIQSPEHSVRLNPLDPLYIKDEASLNAILNGIIIGFTGKEPTDDTSRYFHNGALSLLAGVTWRLKTEFPDKCNLPYLAAFILMADHDGIEYDAKGNEYKIPLQLLKEFIEVDDRASMLASVFMKISNPKEQSSLLGTVASYMRTISDPAVFYLLSANDFFLDINKKNNRKVLSLINTTGTLGSVITPIISMVVETIFQKISESSNEDDIAFVLDEAPRLRAQNLGARVSTLRALGVSFVYLMQDRVQAKVATDGKEYLIDEVLANLSTKFLGKANDPKSAKNYEGYFEEIKETQKSITSGGFFSKGGNRTTTSKKDRREVKDYEFQRLKPGVFYFLSNEVSKKITFAYNKIKHDKVMPPKVRNITIEELEANYLHIINDAKTCFYN